MLKIIVWIFTYKYLSKQCYFHIYLQIFYTSWILHCDFVNIKSSAESETPEMEAEVRIFTLNCWGLGLGISKDRDERMEDIGKYIADNDYDIVFCQVGDIM